MTVETMRRNQGRTRLVAPQSWRGVVETADQLIAKQ